MSPGSSVPCECWTELSGVMDARLDDMDATWQAQREDIQAQLSHMDHRLSAVENALRRQQHACQKNYDELKTGMNQVSVCTEAECESVCVY